MFRECWPPELIHHIFSYHYVMPIFKTFLFFQQSIVWMFPLKSTEEIFLRRFFLSHIWSGSTPLWRQSTFELLFYLSFFICLSECRSLKTITLEQTRKSTSYHAERHKIFSRFHSLHFFSWSLWRKLPLPRDVTARRYSQRLPLRATRDREKCGRPFRTN